MMGRQTGNQSQLFYLFNLERRIPADHLLRRINPVVTRILVEVREQLAPFYSDIGRPSIDPELMIRMLIVGYCYGIRFERRLCEELELHLAYRWFCRLDLEDKVPDHSTFSVNRHGRFRDSDILRQVFEAVVRACMDAGLVKGERFAVDASVMEANASRYRGKAPDEIAWAEPERQTRAVKEYLAALEAETEPNPDRKLPKVISPSDPSSAWTAKANKRDPAHAILLRFRRDRPRCRRAAEQRYELAPSHSITLSARASSVGGTARPSAFAVLRLITSSNLVG
jgi:transposase